MPNDLSTSYTYQPPVMPGASVKASGHGSLPPLYAAADCERVDLGNGGILLVDRCSDRQLIVSPEVARALADCRTFRSLDSHVAHLVSSIPELAGQDDDVRSVLEMLRDSGMLINAAVAVRSLIPESEDVVSSLAPTRVFILTCDRPAALKRLLHSLSDYADLSRHELITLVDDSRDEVNQLKNQQLLQDFNRTGVARVVYLGIAAQRELCDALIEALPDQASGMRFLLDREAWPGHARYGLARNLALVCSAGRRAILLDDDVICRAFASPVTEQGFHFGSAGRQVDAYDPERALAVVHGGDALAGHASCLGMGLV